jgi:hypothetical protein
MPVSFIVTVVCVAQLNCPIPKEGIRIEAKVENQSVCLGMAKQTIIGFGGKPEDFRVVCKEKGK